MKKKTTRGSKAKKANVKLNMRKLRTLSSEELKWAAGGSLGYGSGGTTSYSYTSWFTTGWIRK